MSEKKEPSTREWIVAFVIGLPLGTGAALVQAWCIVQAWAIALVPLGAPRVDLLAVVVVCMAYDTQRMLAKKASETSATWDDPVKEVVVNAVSRSVAWLVFLGFAWLYAAVLR